MRDIPGPAAADIDLATVMHALSDPFRLAFVAGLDERGVAACGEIMGERVAKSTRSHHLRVLREAGVVSAWYVGTVKYARLRRDDLEGRFPGLLDAVVASVRKAGTGTGVLPEAAAPGPAGTDAQPQGSW